MAESNFLIMDRVPAVAATIVSISPVAGYEKEDGQKCPDREKEDEEESKKIGKETADGDFSVFDSVGDARAANCPPAGNGNSHIRSPPL